MLFPLSNPGGVMSSVATTNAGKTTPTSQPQGSIAVHLPGLPPGFILQPGMGSTQASSWFTMVAD